MDGVIYSEAEPVGFSDRLLIGVFLREKTTGLSLMLIMWRMIAIGKKMNGGEEKVCVAFTFGKSCSVHECPYVL